MLLAIVCWQVKDGYADLDWIDISSRLDGSCGQILCFVEVLDTVTVSSGRRQQGNSTYATSFALFLVLSRVLEDILAFELCSCLRIFGDGF